MDWLIDHLFSGDSSQLPQEVSLVFSIIIIFGLVFIFMGFIIKIFKYYFETMRPVMNAEKNKAEIEAAKRQQEDQGNVDNRELVRMIVGIQEKMGDMTTDYAGKYTTKEECKEQTRRIDNALEDISAIKGRIGML